MKYLKNTKELLTIADRKEWLNKNPWAGFKTTYKQLPRQCLTMLEIIRLHQKSLIGRLDPVWNIFLFACFTGYSFQEVLDLGWDMIFIGNDGKRWIKIDRQKTGNAEYLSLLPIPAAITNIRTTQIYARVSNRNISVNMSDLGIIKNIRSSI